MNGGWVYFSWKAFSSTIVPCFFGCALPQKGSLNGVKMIVMPQLVFWINLSYIIFMGLFI